jgi:hypothetical protein
MQKILSYLYPNRVTLLADLAGFNVEYTKVYQRNVKIYNGIDNAIEFDIKNADQKRIDLTTLSNIELHVMDSNGTALPNSPYDVTPTLITGVAKVVIPSEDLADLTDQFLKYSVSAFKDGNDVLLYADSRFGAVGTIELVGDAMPTLRDTKIYKTFTAEIDLMGHELFHSPAIQAKFYEAVTSTNFDFTVNLTGFTGTIKLEATTDDTISVESFRFRGKELDSSTLSGTTGSISFSATVGEFSYFRISFQKTAGTVDSIEVDAV